MVKNDTIPVGGNETVVREDTAKAYRFVHWGWITAAICLAIMAFLFATFFLKSASDGIIESPADNRSVK